MKRRTLLMFPGIAAISLASLARADERRGSEWRFEPDLLRPFWEGTVMHAESVLFVRDSEVDAPHASVLFPIQRVLMVQDSSGTNTWEEGRDYIWVAASGKIVLPAGSRIPAKTPAELRRPAKSQKYELTHRDGNGEIFFGSRLEYAEMQTCVTYVHEPNLWRGVTPKFDASALPRTLQRLSMKEPVTIVVVGDSISAGCNASGWAEDVPFQPPYPELFRHNLEARYQGKVTVVNPSVGGTDTSWVLSAIDKVVEPVPDLVVIAFGMNDAAGRSAEEYRANTIAVMERIRERLPEVEFILVASMPGNADWVRLQQPLFPEYRDALAGLCRPGVAMADVTSVWSEMLRVKKDWDQTGNGVNHPNDFGHRVYAQVISTLLIP